MNDPIIESVIEKLHARSIIGIAKYGTNLQDDPGDLIYWLEHLQTELLDAANYIETLLKRFREVLT